MSTPLKILFFDIETAPLLAHMWRPWDNYTPNTMLVKDSFMLCWAAKWRGGKKVMSSRVTGHEAKEQDDSRIVAELADLVREADIVVAHNVNRFDVPMLNNRLLVMGLEPLGNVRTIDTLKMAKKDFRLAYNKLDYLAEVLGFGKKIKTDFDLWKDCYHGEHKALTQMLRYNKHDVVLLEKVFEKLLPYSNGVGRLVDAGRPEEHACPSCGSDSLMKRGKYRTNASTFQRYLCNDCLKYSRSRSSDKNTRLKYHPL